MRLADKEKHQVANSIFVIDDMSNIVSYYDKSHLVPFGEYVPLRGILPFEKIVPIASDLKAGTGPKTLRIPNAPPAGMLVCYEVIFPHQVVDKTDKRIRPQWLINLTNDGWYGISAGPYQHLASVQMRAVEEGLPIVRVAGTGISAVIYPWGEIMASLALDSQGVLDTPLPKALQHIPLYARLGNIVPLFLCLLFIVFGIYFQKSKKITINS
jgi:apolipoprotein N-acyltransferase